MKRNDNRERTLIEELKYEASYRDHIIREYYTLAS